MFAAAAEGDFSDNLRVNISWISVDNANVVYNSSGKPVGVQAPIVVTFPVITYPGITPAQALANATNAANKAVLYLKAIFAGGASRALLPRTNDGSHVAIAAGAQQRLGGGVAHRCKVRCAVRRCAQCTSGAQVVKIN